MEQAKKTFIEMLPKIYGMYTGGFIAFIIPVSYTHLTLPTKPKV